MDQLLTAVFGVILTIVMVVLSSHQLRLNKQASEGIRYALWWWMCSFSVVASMVAIIVAGCMLQRIYL